MNEELEDKKLSELFRQKLENAEIIPSPHVSHMLMRRVARREFFRFNPSRFNAWYAGGLAAAATALVLILSSGPGSDDQPGSSVLPPAAPVSEKAADIAPGIVSAPETTEDEGAVNNIIGSRQGNEKPAAAGKSAAGRNERNRSKVTAIEKTQPPETGVLVPDLEDRNKLQDLAGKTDNSIDASATEGCAPLTVLFNIIPQDYASCRWSFGDGGYSDQTNPEWIFDYEGEYEVGLRLYGRDGDQSFSSVIIKVHPSPVARFEITPENALIPGDEITFLNYSSGAEEYRWDFGDGTSSALFEPKHSYSRYGNYNVRLVAISGFGCSDSLTVQNAFGSGYYVRYPNAFIPNPNGPTGGYYSNSSDEYAWVFHPAHSGVADYQMRIFTRRGIMVFESNDVNLGWDGYYKGQLVDPGVYIWKVRGTYINGEPFTLMGDVTLLKSQ